MQAAPSADAESEAITVEPTEPTIVRQFAALLDSRDDSLREELRKSRKEMRFLAVGVAGFMVSAGAAGFLSLNASLTDLSVTLARIEADLAVLAERIPIQ